jgi:hypothetical protein
MTNSYQVIRPFSGHEAGTVLAETDFVSVRRIKQLTEQRYIAPVTQSATPTPARKGKQHEQSTN